MVNIQDQYERGLKKKLPAKTKFFGLWVVTPLQFEAKYTVQGITLEKEYFCPFFRLSGHFEESLD